MMKKNGFIATSLIYSFFLIFITLFLTIIADYLQNKVLLNTIEKGIKDEINSSMGIRDFEVGDIIVFNSGCTTYEFKPENAFVVVNTNPISNSIIFYSYALCKEGECGSTEYSDNNLFVTDFVSDILSGYTNNTYYNKIIYNFDKSVSGTYKVNDKFYSIEDGRTCSTTNSLLNTESGCAIDSFSGDVYYRYRKSKVLDSRINKCTGVENSFMGEIYLDWSI